MPVLYGLLFGVIIVIELYSLGESAISLVAGEYFDIMGFRNDCKLRLAELPVIVGLVVLSAPSQSFGGLIFLEGPALGHAFLALYIGNRPPDKYNPSVTAAGIALSLIMWIAAWQLMAHRPYAYT